MLKLYGKIRRFFNLKRFKALSVKFYTGNNYLLFDTWERCYVNGSISSTKDGALSHVHGDLGNF